MPFKKKPYKKVGDIYLPYPPVGATHILFETTKNRKAMVTIKNVDTLLGSVGTIKYVHPCICVMSPYGKLCAAS